MIVTKERVDKLTDDEITKREYDAILDDISDRVDDIWRYICLKTERGLDWWSFENDESYDRGNGSSGGNFDPYTCAKYITIIGEWDYKNQDIYLDGFDTKLLWDEDWQKTIVSNIKAVNATEAAKKLKAKATREANKQKKALLVSSIKGKLTAEELKAITFK